MLFHNELLANVTLMHWLLKSASNISFPFEKSVQNVYFPWYLCSEYLDHLQTWAH
jgi:hypothetical protein